MINNQMNNIQNNCNRNIPDKKSLLNKRAKITNLQEANLIINALIDENISLKNKIDDLEKKFEDYIEKMDLNCYYNQIDTNAYKLERIYKCLKNKEIIKNKKEFTLINRGIKHLFNENMAKFDCVYKTKVEDEFDPSIFEQIKNTIEYGLLIICTKNDHRRFGAFYDNNFKKKRTDFNTINFNTTGNKLKNSIENISKIRQNNYFQNEIIFNSNSYFNNYFAFSLDKMIIYYKEKSNLENFTPKFNIIYNKKFQTLCGEESSDNKYESLYPLTGSNEFNIKHMKLYEIKI